MLTTTIPSESRKYIMMTASPVTGYHFVEFQIPQNYDNNPSIAANIWQKAYLETTSADQAGALLAVIPIEQFKLDQGYSLWFIPKDIPAFLAELSVLLSTLYTDAEKALDNEWERSDNGFEAQLTAIDQFATKYQIAIVDVTLDEEEQ